MQHGAGTAVEAIYEAAASPQAWPRALGLIAALAGASAGTLLFGASTEEIAPLATFGDGELNAALAAATVGAALISRLGDGATGVLVSNKMPLAPYRGEGDDPLVALGASGKVGEALAVGLLREEGVVAALWLFRRLGERFDHPDLDAIRELIPHLSRAMLVHLRVERAERRAAEAGDAFDRVALGAVLVDGAARPILANRAAKRIAAQNDGFVIASDGLHGRTAADTGMLHAAVASVARRSAGTGLGLRLPRTSSSRPYEVMVVPIGRGRKWQARQRATAVVFISDSGPSLLNPAQLLRDLYGLTSAETHLALLLLSGQGMPEAAKTLSVSRNTAHSQLASIFRKTDTTSQAELVRVLVCGPCAVRVPSGSSDAYPPVEAGP